MNPLSYPSCNIRRAENVSRAESLMVMWPFQDIRLGVAASLLSRLYKRGGLQGQPYNSPSTSWS
jgi:hypothetical protein